MRSFTCRHILTQASRLPLSSPVFHCLVDAGFGALMHKELSSRSLESNPTTPIITASNTCITVSSYYSSYSEPGPEFNHCHTQEASPLLCRCCCHRFRWEGVGSTTWEDFFLMWISDSPEGHVNIRTVILLRLFIHISITDACKNTLQICHCGEPKASIIS